MCGTSLQEAVKKAPEQKQILEAAIDICQDGFTNESSWSFRQACAAAVGVKRSFKAATKALQYRQSNSESRCVRKTCAENWTRHPRKRNCQMQTLKHCRKSCPRTNLGVSEKHALQHWRRLAQSLPTHCCKAPLTSMELDDTSLQEAVEKEKQG